MVGCGPGNSSPVIRSPALSLGDHRYMPPVDVPSQCSQGLRDSDMTDFFPASGPYWPRQFAPSVIVPLKRRTGKCTTVSPSPSQAPSALSCTNGRHVSKRNGNATGGSFTPKGIVDFIVAMQRAPLCASIEVVLFCQP